MATATSVSRHSEKVTAVMNCASNEFSKFYSEEQKLWLEDLFKRRTNEVGTIPNIKKPRVEYKWIRLARKRKTKLNE